MGANKQSKPLAESARTVLARRQAPSNVESAAASAAKTINAAPNVPKSPVADAYQNFQKSDDFRPEEAIIKEMSKWDFIKATNIESPRLRTPGQQVAQSKVMVSSQPMASMVRHEEEKKVHEMGPEQVLRGRLSEAQLMELYRELRDSSKSADELAAAFNISGSSVAVLAKVARMPIVVPDPRDEEMRIAK